MANTPGIHSVQYKQLSAAVRKAIFTSAAVTSVAMFSPTTLAESAPIPVQQEQSYAESTSQKKAEESVADLTKVSQEASNECGEGDCEQVQDDSDGINEIRISNEADLIRGDASVELTGVVYTAQGVVDRQDETGRNNQAADSIVGIGLGWTDEDPNTAEDEDQYSYPEKDELLVEFTGDDLITPKDEDVLGKLKALLVENGFEGEITSFRGGELTQEDIDSIFATEGGEFSINVAEKDSAIVTNASGILADSESGDIVIHNSGDIEVGSGERKEYWTEVRTHTIYSSIGTVERNGYKYTISLNGNWIDNGEGRRLDATAYAAGIKASSISGNISITNSGHVSSLSRDENNEILGTGEVATAIEAATHVGNIDITNTGNVLIGAGSAGITAKARQFESDIILSGDGENGELVQQDFSDTLSLEYTNGTSTYSVDREYTKVTPALYKVDENNVPVVVDGEKQIERQKVTTTYQYLYDAVNLKNIDGTDSNIEITNGELGSEMGKITIQGNESFGIFAENPSGDTVTITNHGDIEFETTSEQQTIEAGVGIFVDTTAYQNDINNQVAIDAADCAGTLTSLGTCVIGSGDNLEADTIIDREAVPLYSEMKIIRSFDATNFMGDGGDVEIHNTGDIDISEIEAEFQGAKAAGIHVESYGSIIIDNTGNLDVGANSAGISTLRPGLTDIHNSDNVISLSGDSAIGIQVISLTTPLPMLGMSLSELEMFGGGLTDFVQENYSTFTNGDTNVINSGDITSLDAGHHYTLDEHGRVEGELNKNGEFVPTGVARRQIGIMVTAVNANKRGTDMPWNTYGQEAVEHFNELGSELDDVNEDVEFFDINVINSGDITLGKGARGIQVAGVYGEAFLTNTEDGNITIDDSVVLATADESAFVVEQSIGVKMQPAGQSWTENHFNNEGSIIVGKGGAGVSLYSGFGSSYGVNTGTIQVDDGIVITRKEGTEDEGVARVFSTGLQVSVDGGFNGYAKAVNHNVIETGSHSYGMIATNRATGFSSGLVPELITVYDELSPEFKELVDRDHMRESATYTATAINREDGVIRTGDHSVGMAISGRYNYGLNEGQIILGEGGDAYNFNTLAYFDIRDQQDLIAQGIEISSDDLIAQETRGVGMKTLTDQRSTISLLVNKNEISSEYEDEEGETQFHSGNIGIYAQSLGFAIAGNEGGINLGDDSIGIRATGASAGQAINRLEISVGNDSIGAEAKALASATVLNQGMIFTGDNGTGMTATGAYANAYNIFEISSDNNAETGQALGIQVTGIRASASNQYSFSTIDMGDNSIAMEVNAESLADVAELVNDTFVQGSSTRYTYAVSNDENGNGIEITEDDFLEWKEQNPEAEGVVIVSKIVPELDDEGNEITRQAEEYVLDDNGDIIINEETGHPLTEFVFDEDGEPVMLVKQTQDTNADGEKLFYLSTNAQAVNVASGSISVGTALNGGSLYGNKGIVLNGKHTEHWVETLDTYRLVDGVPQKVDFNHGAFGSVLLAQNAGDIIADDVGIDINNATNTQVINVGNIEASVGIEVDINAVAEHTRSRLDYKPAVDEDGNPIVLPYYDYSKPIRDEEGQLILDENGQVQYETYVGVTGEPLYLQGSQAETHKVVDANGHYVYDTQGNHIYQQDIVDDFIDAALHSAYVSNAGVITAEQGIVITADDNGATFKGDEGGTVIVTNTGTIDAVDSITVLSLSGDVNVEINNSGLINGNIVTTDGDDIFYNGLNAAGTAAGQIHLSDTTFDFKGGNNQMVNRFGDITFAGENEIKLGTHSETYFGTKEVEFVANGQVVTANVIDEELELTRIVNGAFVNRSSTQSYVTISSENGSANDKLLISGDMYMLTTGSVSGVITLETSLTGSDQIIIDGNLIVAQEDGAGNVATDSSGATLRTHDINLNIAPAGQFKGKQELILLSHDEADNAAITVKGDAEYKEVVVQDIKGAYADTVVAADVYENDDGQQVLELVYGLSDLGVSAASVSHIAANFWQESVGKYQDRRSTSELGFSGFAMSFHSDSDVELNGEVEEQELGFAQRMSGLQAGLNYKAENWMASLYVGKGNSEASMVEPNQAESKLEFETFGLSASYTMDKLYVDAVLQSTRFDVDMNSYNTSGKSTGEALGLSLESGYTYQLNSGFNLVPQVQISAVEVDVNPFEENSANYGFVFENEVNTQVRAGLNINKHFEQEAGFIQPFATLSILNTNAENTLTSNSVPFLTDMSGTGYALDAGVNSQYKTWSIDGQVGIYNGETNKNGISFQLSVGYNW